MLVDPGLAVRHVRRVLSRAVYFRLNLSEELNLSFSIAWIFIHKQSSQRNLHFWELFGYNVEFS